MTLLAVAAGLVLSADPGQSLAASADAPRVLQASAAVFGELIARSVGAEVGVSLALWRNVDLGIGASIGSSPGAMVTAHFHFAWDPERRVRPFVQLRARYHPLTHGVGGGAQAGMLLEVGPGRFTLGAAGELFAPVAGYPTIAVMGLVGYEVDLVGTRRAPVEAEARAIEEPAIAAPTAPPPPAAPVAVPSSPDAAPPPLRAVNLRITDPQGAQVVARVALKTETSGQADETRSAEGSQVEFGVGPADYLLEVTAPGFLSRAARFTLAEGEDVALTFELRPVPAVRSAVLREKQIELLQPVEFVPKGDAILPVSFAMLDEVVDLLVGSPQVRQVRIEDHTDNLGSANQNQDLSERRAAVVMRYLIQKGISGRRLTGEGFGATRPIAPQTTEAGRRKNRRVTIEILDRAP